MSRSEPRGRAERAGLAPELESLVLGIIDQRGREDEQILVGG